MKKVLIYGLGKSGIGSAKLLSGKADVSAYDAKAEDSFDSDTLNMLKSLGINLYLGKEPEDNYDELVLSPVIPMDNPLVLRYAAKGTKITGEVELAARYCKGIFVGITGTNGKTTVTTLTGEIFKASGLDTRVVGNIGNAVSECCESAYENTYMITELSSFQLETVSEFHPHISAILNLTPDHLDRHKTFDAYIASKANILKNQTADDWFVYNFDDFETARLAEKTKNVQGVPFSSSEDISVISTFDNAAFVDSGKICVVKSSVRYELCSADELQIPGKHNLENALASAAISIFAGINPKTVARVLKSFKGVEHRLEFVRMKNGVAYVNDSKGTNPDAAIKAINAINTPLLLIAGGYDKHLDFTDFVKSFKGKVAYLILLGVTAPQIKKTALEQGFSDDRIIICNSLQACVASAYKLAEKGDTVLLSPACASWDMFDSYEQRGNEFKELVKAIK